MIHETQLEGEASVQGKNAALRKAQLEVDITVTVGHSPDQASASNNASELTLTDHRRSPR